MENLDINLEKIINDLYTEVYTDINTIENLIQTVIKTAALTGELNNDILLGNSEYINDLIKNKISAREQIFKVASLIKDKIKLEREIISNDNNDIPNIHELNSLARMNAIKSISKFEEDDDELDD